MTERMSSGTSPEFSSAQVISHERRVFFWRSDRNMSRSLADCRDDPLFGPSVPLLSSMTVTITSVACPGPALVTGAESCQTLVSGSADGTILLRSEEIRSFFAWTA